MPKDINPIKVNIAEHEGWAPFDSAKNQQILHSAADAAWDTFIHMPVQEYEKLISDLLGAVASVHDWSPGRRELSSEQLELLSEALRKRNLEMTQVAITDALAWAYEETQIPRDADIRDAIKKATENLVSYFTFYDGDLEFWAPVLESGVSETELLIDLLEETVDYRHQPNHFNRFIEFDFAGSKYVRRLLGQLDERGVKKLQAWLKDFSDEFISNFFAVLKKDMEKHDLSYRFDFDEHWKNMLADRPRMKIVREELNKYLLENPIDVGQA